VNFVSDALEVVSYGPHDVGIIVDQKQGVSHVAPSAAYV
jgi:hypothetical protein